MAWSAASGVVSYYQLQERIDGESWADVSLVDDLSYEARSKVAGDYDYRVRACNGSACSSWSNHNVEVHNLQGIEPAVTITAAHAPGTTSYDTQVTSKGSAQISVPVRMVPGVNNTQPELALHYTSGRARQRQNESLPEDILGYGWQITGFSEIRRCVKGRDDILEVQLSAEDSLCLDGEPLVLTFGSHLQPNSEYRLLRDNFTKVVMQGTATEGWFKVFLPNGEVRELGNTTDSRVRVKDSEGTSPYFLWTINRSTDAFGNSITYHYHKDEVSGINYPLSIKYGYYDDALIQFRYARRDDATPVSLANIQPEQLVLLHTIAIKLEGTKVRELRLASEVAPEGWRRLDQVQECGYDQSGSAPQCLNPLNFDWLTSPESDFKTAIERVTDGLGAVTEFDHLVMTDSGTEGRFSERPFGNATLPADAVLLEANQDGTLKTVVTAMRKSNGVGGMHQTSYRYQGRGLISTKNRGFLGYYAQRSTNDSSGVVTYQQFRLDKPHFTRPAAIHQYDNIYGSHTEVLSKNENGYSEKSLSHVNGNTTIHQYQSRSVRFQYEGNVLLGVRETQVANQYSGTFLTQQTSTTTFAHSVSADGGSGELWGDLPGYSLSGIQRTIQRKHTFQNRIGSPWLIGFVNGVEERFYRGAVSSGNLDRIKTQYSAPHDSSNRAATIIRFPGDPGLELTENRTYTSRGLLNSITQVGQHVHARTLVSNSNFSKGRYPTQQYNAANHGSTRSYDHRFGVTDQETDANGRTSTVILDNLGREISRTNPDGVTETTVYESCDLVLCDMVGFISPVYRIRVHSSVSPNSIQYYDVLGRLIRSVVEGLNGAYIFEDIHYDDLGRIDRHSQPYFSDDTAYYTQNLYDIRNRLEAKLLPNSGSTNLTYTPNSSSHTVELIKSESVYDSGGNFKETQTKISHYDIMGDLVRLTDAVGTTDAYTVTYGYYADGSLRQSTAGGHTTHMTYDNAGNRTTLDDPSLGTIDSQYTALGQIYQTTDSKNQVTTFAYDLLGRKIQETNPDATATWTYDPPNARGALASRSYGTGHSEAYTYNSAAKLVDIETDINVAGFSRSYHRGFTYDRYGRLETSTFPTGATIKHVYNSRGYVAQIQNRANGDPLVTYQARDAYGNITVQDLGNGISQTRSHHHATGQPTAMSSALGATVLQDSTYAWKSNGTLEHRAAHDNGTTRKELFEYDANDRLTGSKTLVDTVVERELTTTYAPNGNIHSKLSSVAADPASSAYGYGGTVNAGPYAVSNANISGIQHTLRYDANGQITEYDAVVGDDRFINWSARNLPTRITLGTAANDPAPTARDELAYDADGGRYYKKSTWVDDQGAQQVEHTFYVGQFEDIVSSASSDYQEINKARIGDNVIHVVATLDSGIVESSFEYLLRNYLGSVEKVTDENGNVLLTQAFDPFGERRSSTWLTAITDPESDILLRDIEITTSRGYTGHEHLSRTGIIHMNGRIYDPRLGRFLSPDPFVKPTETQSWNRYTYVSNNPTTRVDPTGYIDEIVVTADRGNGTSRGYSFSLGLYGPSSVPMAFIFHHVPLDLSNLELDPDLEGLFGGEEQGDEGSDVNRNEGPSLTYQGDGTNGGSTSGGFSDGFLQYYADQYKFISHLDDLSGNNGPEAQRRASIANEIVMTGLEAVVNDVEVQYNGKTYNARQIARNKFTGMVAENPSYFAGRATANVGAAAVISLPFYKGGPLGLVASFTFGTALQTTASLGAGVRAVDNGMTNPIGVIVNGAYGTQ